jgi:hypothetical protein
MKQLINILAIEFLTFRPTISFIVILIIVYSLLFVVLINNISMKTKSTRFYTLKLITNVSDSGVGPFTDIKYIINCYTKNDAWYSVKTNLPVLTDKRFQFDCPCIINIDVVCVQKGYYKD